MNMTDYGLMKNHNMFELDKHDLWSQNPVVRMMLI